MKAESILEYWFGDWNDAEPIDRSTNPQLKLWWGKSDAVDAELRERFGDAHMAAARGELDHWKESREGAIARILLLDQVPRNIFRGSAHMFATDLHAVAATRDAMGRPWFSAMPLIHRYFTLMPLMHSELVEAHELAVEAFGALANEASPLERAGNYAGALEYEHKHKVIIDRFGRYPHRNALLGRVSTAEELAFLEGPGSSF